MDRKDDVLSREYFESVIDELDVHSKKNEELYEELHEKFKDLLKTSNVKINGRGGSFFNHDVAEIGSALSRIRANGMDASYKKIQAKKSVADVYMKKQDKSEENISDIARSILTSIKIEKESNNSNTDKDTEKLDSIIEKSINDGNINITKNDNAMIEDKKGITFKYDEKKEEVVPFNNKDEKIENYPEERIPKINMIKKTKEGQFYMDNGSTLDPVR